MKKEDKELLIKDLCARLSYNVVIDPVDCGKAILIGIKDGGLLLFDTIHKKEYDKPWDIEYIKPYLRPMSSMTEEEWQEYQALKMTDWVEGDINGVFINAGTITDWLNAHHFDYRGLIEKGLAIPVTKENNPYKD